MRLDRDAGRTPIPGPSRASVIPIVFRPLGTRVACGALGYDGPEAKGGQNERKHIVLDRQAGHVVRGDAAVRAQQVAAVESGRGPGNAAAVDAKGG